jgi:hypothetical protein
MNCEVAQRGKRDDERDQQTDRAERRDPSAKLPHGSTELVADLAQQAFAPIDAFVVFDAFALEAVNHAEDAATLLSLCHDHLRWIGSGAIDTRYLRHALQAVEDVDRIKTLPKNRMKQ